MFTIDTLINAYARNLYFIKTHTTGMTHADSLAQPPLKGNCANWIVGHITLYRNTVLKDLGQPSVFPDDIALRYRAGSEPVLHDEPGLAQLPALLAALDASQDMLAAGLRALTPASMSKAVADAHVGRVFVQPRKRPRGTHSLRIGRQRQPPANSTLLRVRQCVLLQELS